ncbi:MAG: Mu-like prophage major head subunit gpT family protein [Litorimonas sp.]
MILNEQSIELAFKGFKTRYTAAYDEAPIDWDKIAMTINSGSREETHGWLGQFPQLREWLGGERQLKDMEAHGFTIVNRKFEATVNISRDDFEDDRLGVFGPMMAEMGHRARQHPEELVFNLLAAGFATTCYDGQLYFDTDHPSVDADGTAVTVSNMQDGTQAPLFLLDTSRAIKPVIWQERDKYDFKAITNPRDARVFMTDEFLYGVRARVNAGFGLWQLAFGSKAELTAQNYAAARRALANMRGDQGRILGLRPTTLVVPYGLEQQARDLITAVTNDGGGSNAWTGTADLIVTPYLDAAA